MNMTSLGIVGGLAGSPLPQARAASAEQGEPAAAQQARRDSGDQSAERSAGIGATDRESETSDRDADGRRLWERNRQRSPVVDGSAVEPTDGVAPAAKDPSGERGARLDLSG